MGLDRDTPEPIEIVVGDARLALDAVPDDAADIVIGDAFGSRSVPFHLATREFLAEVDRVLRPGGVYAANIIDGPAQKFLAAEAATLAQVFDHVVVVRGEAMIAGQRGNAVVIASDTPLDAAEFDRLRRDAGDPGDVLGDGVGAGLGDGVGAGVGDIEAYIDGATIITDDFAPVDQLIAAGS